MTANSLLRRLSNLYGGGPKAYGEGLNYYPSFPQRIGVSHRLSSVRTIHQNIPLLPQI